MADTEDQVVVGSTCMKYRRQSGGVLLINKCNEDVVFAVEQKSSSAGGNKPIINNIKVTASSSHFHPTGDSKNVISVGIGS